MAQTLEDIAKVETQSLLKQNKIGCCLCLSYLKLSFFAFFVPSSPHLVQDLLQKKPVKLPSCLPQQHPQMKDWILCCDLQLSAAQVRKGGLFVTELSSAVPSFCTAISWQSSALPFFVLSLSYFETGTGSGCVMHRNHAGYPPAVERLFIKNKS